MSEGKDYIIVTLSESEDECEDVLTEVSETDCMEKTVSIPESDECTLSDDTEDEETQCETNPDSSEDGSDLGRNIPQMNLQEDVQMMNSPPFLGNNNGQDIPGDVILSDVVGEKAPTKHGLQTQMMTNPPFSGNNHQGQNPSQKKDKAPTNWKTNNPPFSGNNHHGQNPPRVLIISDVERDNAQTNRKENSRTMQKPQFLGNNKASQEMSRAIILSDEGDQARKIQKETTQTTNKTLVLGNNISAPDIPRVLIFCDGKGVNAQNNSERSAQTMPHRQMLGSDSGGRDTASVRILCDDEMDNPQMKQKENTQMISNPGVLGNNNGQERSVLIHSHDSSTEIKPETMTYPIPKKNAIERRRSNTVFSLLSPGYGYLGDPKRNIVIPCMYLAAAQRKPEPKHAARFLVRNLFPREVLLCSTATANSNLRTVRGRQPLDPNTMAALREHLITIFPNHDLTQEGKAWRACISYINCLIRYLCSAARKQLQKSAAPTNHGTPASVDFDVQRGAVRGESSYQPSMQADSSERRLSRNYQPQGSAAPEILENPSLSRSVLLYSSLCYLGDPSRNVLVSFFVLTMASRKPCPQMAASYLVGQMFTADALAKSRVCGDLCHGKPALSTNQINAIREFLEIHFPICDLSESGNIWKMCVESMNHYINNFNPGYSNITTGSMQFSGKRSSLKLESSDTDLRYLGDPQRNIMIPRVHLETAQLKAEPRQAARFLVRNLFPMEVLLCSTAVSDCNLRTVRGRQPLDPNTMAALREYLITIFPNHDLSPDGKDWRACISYINCLIRYLCSVAKKNTERVAIEFEDLDDERGAVGGQPSHQPCIQEVAVERKPRGKSPSYNMDVTEKFIYPYTRESVSLYSALCYLGDSSRNVLVSFSVVTIASKKACPQMAASYLVSQLFTEDVLENSLVYGDLCHSIPALDSNRIDAIREFLEIHFPSCDLSENGYVWKMCVKSMNQYIRNLKRGYGSYTLGSSLSSKMTSSTSKSSDTNSSD